jgi:hypothetical protein
MNAPTINAKSNSAFFIEQAKFVEIFAPQRSVGCTWSTEKNGLSVRQV